MSRENFAGTYPELLEFREMSNALDHLNLVVPHVQRAEFGL
jgi:hypothetical protein